MKTRHHTGMVKTSNTPKTKRTQTQHTNKANSCIMGLPFSVIAGGDRLFSSTSVELRRLGAGSDSHQSTSVAATPREPSIQNRDGRLFCVHSAE
jgi:hypothetical protein